MHFGVFSWKIVLIFFYSLANDLEEDIDLDLIDTFEEFDDDDIDGLEDEEPMSSNIQQSRDMDEDVDMKE